MRVLSLFDGMSCGRVALRNLGIVPDVYHTCEIDKSAIVVANSNFNDVVNHGDVKSFDCGEGEYDLVIAGSPCQGFSFLGEQLNFQHPKSVLYFEFLRLIRKIKPKYFLLENVKMRSEFKDIISNDLGVNPIAINSSRYVAQNRERLYWTNIPLTYLSRKESLSVNPKFSVLETCSDLDIEFIDTSNYEYEPVKHKSSKGIIGLGGLKRKNGKRWGGGSGLSSYSQGYRVYSPMGVSPCLCTVVGGVGGYSNLYMHDNDERKIYRLPQIALERLQGIDDGYTKSVSINKAAFMLGNGWTVGVIEDIFRSLV